MARVGGAQLRSVGVVDKFMANLHAGAGKMTDSNLSRYQAPTAVDLPRSDISAIAETVRRKVEYLPGVSLEDVIKRLGGEVCYSESEETPSYLVVEPEGFAICLPRGTSRARDRFTIAQMLGHYVLHYLYQRQRNRRTIQFLRVSLPVPEQAEKEANWFAAAFLMPAAIFKEKFKDFEKNDLALAEHFGVSSQAVQLRADSLNLRT
ncbi:ImmA/IrrE family metallo-endopeptidase [Dokdonella immobilis]|uniref:ImmA/IrrE family metallo-endopeptidase n=1 Tax=Dokdonella immobilis TaxID=578942 RepID=UPI000B81CD01|nr:ImmA/IrrE family metallo-endopeptidase [Dokdonella immobilis]